jgi:hypothetical protein
MGNGYVPRPHHLRASMLTLSDDTLMFIGTVSLQHRRVVAPYVYHARSRPPSSYTQVLFSVTAALCIVCCFYGSGQMSSSLPPAVVSKGTKVRHLNILVEGAILNRIALLYCGILLLYQRHVHQALGGCRALAYCCHSQSLCLVPLGAHGCRNHCCTGFRRWYRKHLYVWSFKQ